MHLSSRRPARLPARILAVSAAALLAGAALTGCSASGGQSKTDACIVVANGLEAVQGQIAGANTALTTGDLLTVQANLADASSALSDLAPQVTNAEISPILTALTSALDKARTAVTDAGTQDADAATEALHSSAGDLQTAATQFNEACGS